MALPRVCALALANPHPPDERIVFEDEGHVYKLDGKKVPLSVSGLWGQYFTHFDPQGAVEKYFAGWKTDPNSKYHQLIKCLSLVLKMDDAEAKQAIVKLWAAGGEDASGAGTEMHAEIEYFLNGMPEAREGGRETKEFKDQFLPWMKWFCEEKDLRPYRTEWSVFDEEAKLAGQIDSLWRSAKDGTFVMVDWKRCTPAGRRPTDPLQRLGPDVPSFRGEKGIGPCSHLPNTKFFHYCIQQNLYKYIVERHYGIKVERMYLAQFHPLLPEYHCVAVPDMQDVVGKIMEERYEEVRTGKKREREPEEGAFF